MKTQNRWPLALAALALLTLLGGRLWAAEPVTTKITVERLCPGCAKKIAAKLQEVPGVGDVKADVPAKAITVAPKAQMVLSPRSLWEAVEKGGEKPIRLEGPSGTFTSKPKS